MYEMVICKVGRVVKDHDVRFVTSPGPTPLAALFPPHRPAQDMPTFLNDTSHLGAGSFEEEVDV